jgi:hypothetical protein
MNFGNKVKTLKLILLKWSKSLINYKFNTK